MKRNCLVLTTFVVVSVLFFQVGCQEQAEEARRPKPALELPKAAPEITFEKLFHDFGQIGPGTKKSCEFKFSNTGNGVLKIRKTQPNCSSCTVAKLTKREYAPGEEGALKITYRAGKQPGLRNYSVLVSSNDSTKPNVRLAIKAKVVSKVDYEPEQLKLLLKGENTDCPEITLRSLDGRPFSIKQFKSTRNCITADYDSSVKATKFVLKPKVDFEKLKRNLNGRINIGLTHPECKMVTIFFAALPRFAFRPMAIVVFNAEPQKPVKKELWILNNYGEDFEVESVSSKKGTVEVLSQEKVGNRYKFELEMTPPAAKGKRVFTDVFLVNIEGGERLRVNCNGFYARGAKVSSN